MPSLMHTTLVSAAAYVVSFELALEKKFNFDKPRPKVLCFAYILSYKGESLEILVAYFVNIYKNF